ncbi:hypothetical protein E1163_25095 [Fulvivirga kasyanovii]|uniref:Transposase n=1 Tax=Fulvivirga kasyanovii TaxID=396812 RepID=A0ABW9RX55_9BACT|nr:hypothetical protein [Fulvivirga kasyanovii]
MPHPAGSYLSSRSRKYKFHDQSKLYFVSFATVYWIDLFVREDYNKELSDNKMMEQRLDYLHLNLVIADL